MSLFSRPTRLVSSTSSLTRLASLLLHRTRSVPTPSTFSSSSRNRRTRCSYPYPSANLLLLHLPRHRLLVRTRALLPVPTRLRRRGGLESGRRRGRDVCDRVGGATGHLYREFEFGGSRKGREERRRGVPSRTSLELDADPSFPSPSSTTSTPITSNKYVLLPSCLSNRRLLARSLTPFLPQLQVFEVMLAATVAGELSMMSRTKRNATVVAGQSSHLWRLDIDSWDRLEREKPEIAREFTRILLRSEFGFLSSFISRPPSSLFRADPYRLLPFSFSHC